MLKNFLIFAFMWSIASQAQSAGSREDRYIVTQDTPAILGVLQETRSRKNPADQLTHVKEIYLHKTETHRIVTHLSKILCGLGDETDGFHLMAIQYLPNVPKSFKDAQKHDFFKEVYVRDDAGRLRLYEDVNGQQMLELFARFEPNCMVL